MNDEEEAALKRLAQTDDGKTVLDALDRIYYHARFDAKSAAWQSAQRHVVWNLKEVLR